MPVPPAIPILRLSRHCKLLWTTHLTPQRRVRFCGGSVD
jgi:hypothetical protein